MSDEFRWKAVTKDPAEVLPVALNLFGLCANFWLPNEDYQLGDIVWPIVETPEGEVSGIGHCFECTTAGRSGSRQPKFANADNTSAAVAAGQVIAKPDGSAGWTCRVAGSGGINAVSAPQAYPPTGITVPGLAVNENMKLFVDYAGGVLDEDHEVMFTFLIGGRLRVGRQVVQVRAR